MYTGDVGAVPGTGASSVGPAGLAGQAQRRPHAAQLRAGPRAVRADAPAPPALLAALLQAGLSYPPHFTSHYVIVYL